MSARAIPRAICLFCASRNLLIVTSVVGIGKGRVTRAYLRVERGAGEARAFRQDAEGRHAERRTP
jgi:hypothetical protein